MKIAKIKLSIKLLILKTKVVWLTLVAGYQRLIGSNVYVKYVLIAIPSLLLFGAYFVSLYYSNTQIIDLKVANISSGSATITWVTKDTTKTAVYVKEDSKFWPLEYLFRTKYIDDRDIDTSDNKRTTHFVTISDLSPDTNYYFKVGTSRVHVYSTNVLAFETKPVSDNFESPNPIYGSVNFRKEELAIADTGDSIIYVLPETGSDDEEYYATLVNSDDNWVINSPIDEGNIELQVVTDGEVVASKQIDASVESLADVHNIDLAVDGTRDNLASASSFDYITEDDKSGLYYFCQDQFNKIGKCGSSSNVCGVTKTSNAYSSCDLAQTSSCQPAGLTTSFNMGLYCENLTPVEKYPYKVIANGNNNSAFYCLHNFSSSTAGCTITISSQLAGHSIKETERCHMESNCDSPMCTPKNNSDWALNLLCPSSVSPTPVPGEEYGVASRIPNGNTYALVYCKTVVPSCATANRIECGLASSDIFGGDCDKTNARSLCVPSNTCNFAEGACKSTAAANTYSRYCRKETAPTLIPTSTPSLKEYPYEEFSTLTNHTRYCKTDIPSCQDMGHIGDCGLASSNLFGTDSGCERVDRADAISTCVSKEECTMEDGVCLSDGHEVTLTRYCKDEVVPTYTPLPVKIYQYPEVDDISGQKYRCETKLPTCEQVDKETGACGIGPAGLFGSTCETVSNSTCVTEAQCTSTEGTCKSTSSGSKIYRYCQKDGVEPTPIEYTYSYIEEDPVKNKTYYCEWDIADCKSTGFTVDEGISTLADIDASFAEFEAVSAGYCVEKSQCEPIGGGPESTCVPQEPHDKVMHYRFCSQADNPVTPIPSISVTPSVPTPTPTELPNDPYNLTVNIKHNSNDKENFALAFYQLQVEYNYFQHRRNAFTTYYYLPLVGGCDAGSECQSILNIPNTHIIDIGTPGVAHVDNYRIRFSLVATNDKVPVCNGANITYEGDSLVSPSFQGVQKITVGNYDIQLNIDLTDNQQYKDCNYTDDISIDPPDGQLSAYLAPTSGTCLIYDFMEGGNHSGVDFSYSWKKAGFPVNKKSVYASNEGVITYIRMNNIQDSSYEDESLGNYPGAGDHIGDICYSKKDEKDNCDWKPIGGTGGRDEGYGNLIIIAHYDNGKLVTHTHYAHLLYGSIPAGMSVGDRVHKGKLIGMIGNNGISEGPHLHFDVRDSSDSTLIDPNEIIGMPSRCSSAALLNNQLPNVAGLNTYDTEILKGDAGLEEEELDTSYSDYPLTFDPGIYNITFSDYSYNGVIIDDKEEGVKIYIDNNQNNIYDSNDTLFKGDQLDVDIDKVKSLQKMQISQNWNAYQITLSNESYASSKDVMAQVETLDQYLEFAVFRDGQWVIQKYDTVYKSLFGEDIELVDGETIFIKGSVDGAIVLVGDDLVLDSDGVKLSSGWNFVSFDADAIAANNLTSYSLLTKCNEGGLMCSSLSSYEGRVNNTVINKNGKLFGVDFPLESNKPYIIKVYGEGGELKF